MSKEQMPKNYQQMQDENPKFMQAVSDLGQTARSEGPLDAKTTELIQMAGSAALRLEGAVHSHTRRAMDAGATKDEIKHALLVLTSTIGFPAVAAAMSWMRDITGD